MQSALMTGLEFTEIVTVHVQFIIFTFVKALPHNPNF